MSFKIHIIRKQHAHLTKIQAENALTNKQIKQELGISQQNRNKQKKKPHNITLLQKANSLII